MEIFSNKTFEKGKKGQAERCLIAREHLGLNQTEASLRSNVRQKNISLIEHGKRETIPYEYLKFFFENGINLNWIILGEGEMLLWQKEDTNDKSKVAEYNLLERKPQDMVAEKVVKYKKIIKPKDDYKQEFMKLQIEQLNQKIDLIMKQFIDQEGTGNQKTA